MKNFFSSTDQIGTGENIIRKDEFLELFEDSYRRKAFIGKLVNMLMNGTEIIINKEFQHHYSI